MALKYNVGDRVRIKSLDWYNENKASDDEIRCYPLWFGKEHSKWCGKVMTISHVRADHYTMVEDLVEYWTDEMIESLVERNGKIYPYKIGDRVILKGNNRLATITDLKYNSFGNLSYYIKIDNDKDISTDCPTDLLLPYDNIIKGCVEEETKPKFKVGDKIITDTNMKGTIIEVVEEGWYRVEFEPYNGIPQPNGIVPEENMSFIEEEIGLIDSFSSRWINEFNLPDGYIFKDQTGNEIHTTKIVLEKANTLKIQSNNMETETHRGYCTTEEETTNKSKKVEWFTFWDNDFADKVELDLSNRELIQEDGKWFVVKKKKEYPKTYEECLSVLGIYNGLPDVEIYNAKPSECKLFESFIRLKRCRDAYWKIAGDEMGLGKPWEPDWSDEKEYKYVICRLYNNIVKDRTVIWPKIFAFPTEEMRDAFKENFDPDIEICNEFL